MNLDAPVVYLAHPIDQGRAEIYVEQATEVLAKLGCVIYDPQQAWTCPAGFSPLIHTANMRVLDTCEFMVAVLHPQVLSVGTITEMQYKVQRHPGKVLVYGPDLLPSVALHAMRVPIVGTVQDLSLAVTRLTNKED